MRLKSNAKDKLILFGWIAGLMILISVIWVSTGKVQADFLARAVNNVFIDNGDPRRAGEYLSEKTKKAGVFGYWYSLSNSASEIFVFTVFQNGILVPFGAVISSGGEVSEIIPLSAHAAEIHSNLPDSVTRIYVSKIAKSASAEKVNN